MLPSKSTLGLAYIDGIEMTPEVKIYEERINNQTYYIAETTDNVDFEFKDRKLMKMWDVQEEKTYHPDTVMKILREKNNTLSPAYNSAKTTLDHYLKSLTAYKEWRVYVHNKNLIAKNNIRKAEKGIENAIPSIKRSIEAEPPVIHKRGPPACPEWMWADNPRYIVRTDGFFTQETSSLNNARAHAISLIEVNSDSGKKRYMEKPIKIYERSGKEYVFRGMVRFGTLGIYRMTYFMNKNGAFQMNGDGGLVRALYRW